RRMRQLIDELRDVVLEEALLVRVEEGDGLLAVGGVGSRETEVELGAGLVDGGARDPELRGAILLDRERLRIDDVQVDHAARALPELLEEVVYPLAVGTDLRDGFGGLGRVEEVEVDRLLDALQDPVGAGRDGVQAILGEIELP